MKRKFRITILLAVICGAFGTGRPAAGQQAPYRLTLHEAIQKGLQANVSVLTAGTRVDEAEATRLRRLAAALLPRLTAQSYANVQNRDLRAFGISIPGMPEVVGPFSNYYVGFAGQQNLVDLASYRSVKASERAVDASRADDQDARDLVVRAIAAYYLNAESAAARAKAAKSRVTDSTALLKLARDKHDAGTATGVDVLRAEVQLANDKQALLVAENQMKQALIALARNLGLSPGVPLELAEELRFEALDKSDASALTTGAIQMRADVASLESQRRGLLEQQRANAARFYPKLSLNGNFGGIGRSVGGMQGTGLLQGQVDFTVFDRDREGEAQELASRVRRIDDQIADLRRGVEEDVREALLNLQSAAEQVDVAKDGQQLAQRELELAQDRFETGAANNIEVVTAQDELARAEENYILAVTSHVDAKFALARALGNTEKNIEQFGASR